MKIGNRFWWSKEIGEQFLEAPPKTLPQIADFWKLFPTPRVPHEEKYLPLIKKNNIIVIVTICDLP